ncbi:F0F1 ATP synthase subunit epsilon [Rickettsiales bacterium]|nr:F0F1 ATP synthase subunit epsilon [Rickettsiales bacterium]
MQPDLMQLKILLPFKVFAQKDGVKSIVANTDQGLLGLLPNRLDCVAVLTPGILSWQSQSERETVIAVDDGILVKTGKEVLISVRNAIGGKDIKTLHEAVTKEFIKESDHEKEMRLTLAKLESGFIHRFAEWQHG